jgi:hypothetical protein
MPSMQYRCSTKVDRVAALETLVHQETPIGETAIVGDPDWADTQALLSAARARYHPFQVVALAQPDSGSASSIEASFRPISKTATTSLPAERRSGAAQENLGHADPI